MNRLAVLLLGLVLIAGIGAACARGSETGNTTTNPPSQAEAVEAAKAKLAEKLNIDAASIELVRAEAVDWPDTSLGLPEPGKAYAQVITPGFKIILSAGGTEYEYHTGNPDGKLTVVGK